MALRVFAHGGGVQSTAALVLSAQGRIDFPVHLFCNVGDDSENPATLEYVREVSVPFAAEHGIRLEELRRTWRDGRNHTLLQHVTKPEQKGIQIPLHGVNGYANGRKCTYDFKVGVIQRWLKHHGATPEDPATTGVGISSDEAERASGKNRPLEILEYPLLQLGLYRTDCRDIIQDAGLPIPPKSSCYFCPFHRPQVWREMARDEPELFEKAARLEDVVLERQARLGKPPLYLTGFGAPIREVISPAQATLFDGSGYGGETCDEGVCFT